MFKKLIKYFTKDLWLFNLEELPRNRSFFIKQLRVLVLAVRGFNEDRCSLRASALTMFSILSVVPVLALAFGIAKGFGLEEALEVQIQEAFAANPDIASFLLDFAHSALQNTKGGLVAGVGVIVLIWTVMRVLSNIEGSFNEIWQIKRSRSLFRKFTDYLTIILVAPLLVVFSSSITGFASANAINILESVEWLSFMKTIVTSSLDYLAYLIIWVVLTLLYIIMPNTKVKLVPALIAGIIAGTFFQWFEQAYIWFQVEVSTYNAIYGSFAALPLFILWLQVSWLLVLFGAELSFAHQNVDYYQYESGVEDANDKQRTLLSVMIVKTFIDNFQHHHKPITASDLSKSIGSPIRLIRTVLDRLEQAEFVARVAGSGAMEEDRYILATDTHDLTLADLLNSLSETGQQIPLGESEILTKASSVIEKLRGEFKKSPHNILVRDL